MINHSSVAEHELLVGNIIRLTANEETTVDVKEIKEMHDVNMELSGHTPFVVLSLPSVCYSDRSGEEITGIGCVCRIT